MSADDTVDVRTCPAVAAMSGLSTYALIAMKYRGGEPWPGSAVAAGPGVPAVLGSVDGIDVRRPGLVGRAPAHGRPGAARGRRRDGVPDRAAVAAEPAVRAARRGLGGPARQAAAHDDPRRPGPRRGAGDHPAVLRAACPDDDADVPGDVRDG